VNNEIRPYYTIEDVDVDRYMIDGELTQVMVSARELDEDNIPGEGWVIDRLVYTHGFGAVVSPANEVVGLPGAPAALVDKIPPQTEPAAVETLTIDQPRIYFSDSAETDHVIVGSNESEVDFPVDDAGRIEETSYEGAGGIDLGGIFQRAAFALRFGEVNVLISGQLTEDSKVLLERNIRARVSKVAPFLHTDADPYLVVLGGRLLWVVDMYTTTDWYPYSSPADTSRLDRVLGLPQNFNYVRNSVKATVDAFDGTMTFYVVDPTDPLIAAQKRIFPKLFTDDAEMSAELREHLRYPDDMFRIQSDMYRLYHVTTGEEFFQEVDPWQIARDPSTSTRAPLRAPVLDSQGNQYRPMLPYYLLMKLPQDDELSFIIMQPFTPRLRPNMTAFLVGKSGPTDYGRIIDYTLPSDRAQPGPGQVGDLINQNTVISEQFTLLSTGGSELIQGEMLVVPIEESLLYVQPIYVAADTGGTAGVPELNRVIVSFDGRIEISDNLAEALDAVFGDGAGGAPDPPDVDPPDPGDPTDPSPLPDDVASLIEAAQRLFAEADQALRDGNLSLYAEKIAEAQASIDEAAELLGQAVGTVSG
jgi:uncharacterized membrane protein (UPF0182 family)